MKNELFKEYFLRYKNLVMRVVMRKTGDYQAAQEICQQVFFAFYINMEKIPDELVKAWLIRCTQNAVVDYFRKSKTHAEVYLDTTTTESGSALVEESIELFTEQLCNRDLTGRILRTVKATNEKWYEVLVLSCVEGLSYAEMAERLHASETVLRARMYRARQFVKEKFGDEYFNRDR